MLLKTGTFRDFMDGKFAVIVPSSKSKQYKALMEKCVEHNMRWACGNLPFNFHPFSTMKNITISTYGGDLVCGQLDGEMLPVILYKNLVFDESEE